MILKQFYMIFKKLVTFALYFRTWRFHFIFDYHFPAVSQSSIMLKNRFQTCFTVWNLSLTPAKIVRCISWLGELRIFPTQQTDRQTEQHVSRHPYFVWWWSSFNKPAASNRYWSLSKISDFVTDTEGVSERKWFTFCHTHAHLYEDNSWKILDIAS